ncbi:MAG TPA: pyridoxal 5'-phosphate synthase, partial [Actinomycetota bacterium]|nr:pyridoxal 5'-phosphate synthase [Actinomycetota bacterium]
MRDEDDRPLDVGSLPSDPLAIVRRWLEEAEAAGIRLPNAIALATADADGRPSIRHVLLRGIDATGFVFYTNRGSRKGREVAENPRAAFALYWRELDRQVTVAGDVEAVSDADADAYFATRPREARLGAWASRQSEPLASRE